MTADKKKLYILSGVLLAALLIVLFVPLGESGRIFAAILLLPSAVLLPMWIKKRNILSINKSQILLIMTVMGLVYVMLYYMSGLAFGFVQNLYRLTVSNFFRFILPIGAVIVFTEIIRFVIVAQGNRLATILCYLTCVAADLLIYTNIPSVTTFVKFMTLMADALFPALVGNLLYNYLSKRYGMYPNLVFRLLITLHAYIFPVESAIAPPLLHFFEMLVLIGIYIFVDSLYENRPRFALKNPSRFLRWAKRALTLVVIIIMLGTLMLISNQFHYGAFVIATESMTGELNKGDVAIFEKYEDQSLKEGQVIVFDQNGTVVIHRIVDIKIINEQTRYYTKGDANEDTDAGFRTDGDIIGVVSYKLPFFGYPTLWLRSLFKR